MRTHSFLFLGFFLLSLFLFIGCSTLASHIESESVTKKSVMQDPTRAYSVKVFKTAKDLPEKYTVIAKLKSKGDFCCDSQEKLIRAFQEKAVEVGANAIILEEVTTEKRTSLVQTVQKDASDLSPEEKWGPVTLEGPLTLNLSGKNILYKGYALAIELPIQFGFE